MDTSLIAYLDRLYPNQCPDPTQDERSIWMAVGARQVVNHLQSVLQEQSKP